MLRREEAERHSDATQAAFGVAEAAGSETDWLEVVSAMQARVVREAGVPSGREAAALWLLRTAASLWPDDAELQMISCWVRHNRATSGSLVVGDGAPDLPLHAIVSASPRHHGAARGTSVLRACARKPTLLVAGSFT